LIIGFIAEAISGEEESQGADLMLTSTAPRAGQGGWR